MGHDSSHNPAEPAIPLACDPLAIHPDQRADHQTRAVTLFQTAIQEQQELPDGLAFRFAATDYELVTHFIGQERRCCPFFRFTLEIAPNNGPIWLRITGSDGVKAILVAGLDVIFTQAGGAV